LLVYLLYGLFILACVILVVVVLLQPGKADAGALFSSSLSSTAFGPRGTASLLSKITIGAAAAFMLIALMLSLPAFTGSQSVLQSTNPEPEASPTQQPSPAASPSVEASSPPAESSPAATENTSPAAGGEKGNKNANSKSDKRKAK